MRGPAPMRGVDVSEEVEEVVGGWPREPWETTTWDVEHWSCVLDEFGVDRTSRQELFLLSQLPNGAEEANNIVAKFLKKSADHERLDNPSAFLHSCVRNVRHTLNARRGNTFGDACPRRF